MESLSPSSAVRRLTESYGSCGVRSLTTSPARKKAESARDPCYPDQVHMCLEISPKAAVASVMGFLKGKRALASARRVQKKERNFTGEHFWARGYAVSTVGFALESVQKYIREQEKADQEGRF